MPALSLAIVEEGILVNAVVAHEGLGRRVEKERAGGGKGEEQNSVLLEIFKSNLNLVRGMQDPEGTAASRRALVRATVVE